MTDFDIIVIGGGPGGYNCAIRATQLGFKVACVEKNKLGGVCLNVGCIPSKALLESSHQYEFISNQDSLSKLGLSTGEVSFDLAKVMQTKDKIVSDLSAGVGMLLSANGIKSIVGTAEFIDQNNIKVTNGSEETKFSAKYFVIATGSTPVNLKDTEFDEKIIISSDSAIALNEVPKELVVIGAGVIGLELGSVWSRFGAKVTVLEYLDVIAPTMDKDISSGLLTILKKHGINFELGVSVTSIEKKDGRAIVHHSKGQIECDKVLVAIGRAPFTTGLGLEKIGIKLDERKRIPVDKTLKTIVSNIYAIGDVVVGPMLAHKAEEDGVAAAEFIAGQKPSIHYDIIPAVIYTHPEAASIGKTEQELKAAGIKYNIGKASFASNGRAKTLRDTDGFVKLICDEKNNVILGGHILHSAAGTLINELSAYFAYSAAPDDIALTTHTHPDLNEVIRAAALDVLGRPLSALPKIKK